MSSYSKYSYFFRCRLYDAYEYVRGYSHWSSAPLHLIRIIITV
jgi:hypothetical protein